jgi:hypothetical protein
VLQTLLVVALIAVSFAKESNVPDQSEAGMTSGPQLSPLIPGFGVIWSPNKGATSQGSISWRHIYQLQRNRELRGGYGGYGYRYGLGLGSGEQPAEGAPAIA